MKWFYLKNVPEASLLAFIGRVIAEQSTIWSYGWQADNKKKLVDVGPTFYQLIDHGVKAAGVIGAYNVLRVASLMECEVPIF